MKPSSRRTFLATGLALPAAGLANAQQAASPASKEVKFTYRTLGKTGLKVTSLSFGCMTTSDGTVVERAADMGVLHFDTARSYQGGNNERMVGAALKGKRQKVVLSSKTEGTTKAEALAQLDTSLRELATDHLDIWYLHQKNNPADVTDDLLEAQRIAKQAAVTGPSILHQLDFHHFLKAPGLAANPGSANPADEELIQFPCFFRRRCGIERRTLSSPHIPIQGELRNRQHAAAHVGQSQIHLPRIVFKHAQARDFFREINRIRLRILPAHPKQNQQSRRRIRP